MPSLLNLLPDYDGELRPSAELNFTLKDVFPALHEEHKKVVDAILAADAAAAHSAMFHHMSLVEESFERLAETI